MSTGFDSPTTALEPAPIAQATTAAQMRTLRLNRRPTGGRSPARPGRADKTIVLSATKTRRKLRVARQGSRLGRTRGSRKQSFLVRLLVPWSTAVVSVSLRDFTRSFFGRRVLALLLWVGLLRHSYSPPRVSKLERMGVIDDMRTLGCARSRSRNFQIGCVFISGAATR